VKDEMPVKNAPIDARLRELLAKWSYETSPAIVVAMGTPALERLLDSLEGKVGLYLPNATELEGREYENARSAAVAAFAKSDLSALLDSIERRKWPAASVAYSVAATVVDSRIVPYLIAAYASKDPADRLRAVNALAIQNDARATATLTTALKDRSSAVREVAAKALKPSRKRKSKG
jgi:HEAT repeat protein